MMMQQHQQDEVTCVSIPQTTVPAQEPAVSAEQSDVRGHERVKRALQHEVFRRKRRERLGGVWLTIWLLPLVYGYFTGQLGNWASWLVMHPFIGLLYYLLLLLPLPLLIGWQGRQRIAGHAGDASELDDLSLIGPLVDTLRFDDRRIRAQAGATLARLLPKMQATDAHLLNAAQRTTLCRILAQPLGDLFRTDLALLFTGQTHHMATLQVAILKAFEQVGDAKALAVVEQVVARPAKTTDQQWVLEAARDCLPFLQLRVEQERAHQTLLRASSGAETNPDILLRPAAADSYFDVGQLLRPELEPPSSSPSSSC